MGKHLATALRMSGSCLDVTLLRSRRKPHLGQAHFPGGQADVPRKRCGGDEAENDYEDQDIALHDCKLLL